MTILFIFLALQFADLATTLIFLRHGIAEANPLVASAIATLASPTCGVALVKATGCALGVYCWRSRRMRLLRYANLFFAACVAWNLVALAPPWRGSARRMEAFPTVSSRQAYSSPAGLPIISPAWPQSGNPARPPVGNR